MYKIPGLENLIEAGVRRHRRSVSAVRVDAGEGQAEELPSFPPVDLENEDVLVVAVDVESAH